MSVSWSVFSTTFRVVGGIFFLYYLVVFSGLLHFGGTSSSLFVPMVKIGFSLWKCFTVSDYKFVTATRLSRVGPRATVTTIPPPRQPWDIVSLL